MYIENRKALAQLTMARIQKESINYTTIGSVE